MIRAPSLCVPCNDLPCIDCGAEIPTVREGWAEAGTDAAPSHSPWLLFECLIADACIHQPGQKCRPGHMGELCNVCEDNFVFVDKLCKACTSVNSSPALYLIASAIVLAAAGLGYAKYVQRSTGADRPTGLLHAQLTTDNPLQSDSESTDNRQSLSMATVQRTDDAFMLLRVLYQPVRILVGYIQVVSQIGLVLDIKLPPNIAYVFEWLKPFAGLLTELFHLGCIGSFSFYQKWIIKVFLVPAALLSAVMLRYVWVRYRGDATAAKNAAGSLRSNVFFILFLLYRTCTSSAPVSLINVAVA